MRKILFLFLAFAFLTSCGSDDSVTILTYQEAVVGKWLLVDYNDAENSDISQILIEEPCAAKTFVEFKSDLVFVESSFGGKDCSEVEISTVNYEIVDNVMTTISKGGGATIGSDSVIKYYIKELTASKLAIQGFYYDDGVEGRIPELKEKDFYTLIYKRIQ